MMLCRVFLTTEIDMQNVNKYNIIRARAWYVYANTYHNNKRLTRFQSRCTATREVSNPVPRAR